MNKRNDDIISNRIVLRSVNGKTSKYYIQPCPDSKTGRFPNHVKSVDKDGNMRLTEKELQEESDGLKHFIKLNEMFIIQDGTTFDLNDVHDKAIWEAIKNCVFIAESRDARNPDGTLKIDGTIDRKSENPRYGSAELYVDRPGLATKNRVSRKKQIHNAIAFILGDERGYEGLLLKAKLLGREMDNLPVSDVEDYLLQIAEKDPERIITLYTADDILLRLLFIDAKKKKIITYHDKAYFYGDTLLAATDEAVITWMKQARNKTLMTLIREDVYPEYADQSELDMTESSTKKSSSKK